MIHTFHFRYQPSASTWDDRPWMQTYPTPPGDTTPVNPFVMAHDILEHPHHPEHTIEEELRAQGAALFVRPDATGSVNFQSGVSSDIRFFLDESLKDGVIPNWHPDLGKRTVMDARLRNALVLSDRQRAAYPQSAGWGIDFRENVLLYMEEGYRWATRRYSSRKVANNLFEHIYYSNSSMIGHDVTWRVNFQTGYIDRDLSLEST